MAVMKVRERAAYAWGRIVSLFTGKKPEIEVEIEELPEEDVIPEARTEEITAEINEAVSFETNGEETQEDADSGFAPSEGSAVSRDASQGEEEIPSRMTDEYKAWLRAQMEAEEIRADKNTAHEQTE